MTIRFTDKALIVTISAFNYTVDPEALQHISYGLTYAVPLECHNIRLCNTFDRKAGRPTSSGSAQYLSLALTETQFLLPQSGAHPKCSCHILTVLLY